MSLLMTRDLCKSFGGVTAVSDLDLDIEEGEIRGIIGPNGAGKTTLFNLISGYFPPSGGNIEFNGKNVTRLKAYDRASLGLVRTFQENKLVKHISVYENVNLAHHLQAKSGFWRDVFNTSHARKEEKRIEGGTAEILEFVGLSDVRDEAAGSLPHGLQRMLGIAMALAAAPKLLLLDEPVTGMNAEETHQVMELMKQMKGKGITVCLVEHNMRAVMKYCGRLTVLNYGSKIAEGTPAEVAQNKNVIDAYLGVDENVA